MVTDPASGSGTKSSSSLRGTLRIVGCENSRVLSVSQAPRQLLVGKQRHAPPAQTMLPESFFCDSGGIMLS
jgi:hypothetical protein